LTSPTLAEVEQEETQQQQPHQAKLRLYSSQRKIPQDEVAPQHQEIHALLGRWGSWNADKYRANSCYSVESRYREQTARATGYSVDPLLIEVERAVLGLPVVYRDTIRAFYVTRESPSYICKMINMPDIRVKQEHAGRVKPDYAGAVMSSKCRAFVAWMFTARAMVINLMRRNAAHQKHNP
jgi:hypothetical protein